MKHRISFRKLQRSTERRTGLLKTMVTQLIKYERIETTLPKAKELRRVAERVVTYGKQGSEKSWQMAADSVCTEPELFKVFTELAHRYRYRPGGYTRVIRSRIRRNDTAQMAFIEFVDREGELRPARPPLVPLLPRSAQILADSPSSEKLDEPTTAKEGQKETEKKETPDEKPKRFFGLF